MIIEKYNVKLRRLEKADLELVRLQRNSPAIRTRMFYQEEITLADQEKWFDSINNAMHYYFVIEAKGKSVGLLNGNIRSFDEGTIEAGIFIWDQQFLASRTAAASALCVLDFHFTLMNMKEVFIEVRTDNQKAIGFNEYLGFKRFKEEHEAGRIWLYLEKENYLAHTQKLRRGVMRAAKETKPLDWEDIHFSEMDRPLLQELPESIYQGILPSIPTHLRRQES
jgi:RimJ/RimL family protein N-acetyltransferase